MNRRGFLAVALGFLCAPLAGWRERRLPAPQRWVSVPERDALVAVDAMGRWHDGLVVTMEQVADGRVVVYGPSFPTSDELMEGRL